MLNNEVDMVSTVQLLIDTGLNAFAAKLLAESYDNLPSEVKNVLPKEVKFKIGNCVITLSKYEE